MSANLGIRALVNETEAARILGISVKTARRYHPAELDAFIEAGRRRSTSDLGEAA